MKQGFRYEGLVSFINIPQFLLYTTHSFKIAF